MPVHAQDATGAAADPGKPPLSGGGTATGPSYISAGPINLRAGAFVSHPYAQDQQQKNNVNPYTPYTVSNPFSAQSYNQSQVTARSYGGRGGSGNSIPSPFPAGYGDKS